MNLNGLPFKRRRPHLIVALCLIWLVLGPVRQDFHSQSPAVVLDDFSGARANPGNPGSNLFSVYTAEDPGQTYTISGGQLTVRGTPGVYWHFQPYPYVGVKGFAKGWIEGGAWDPNINRMRLSFVCTTKIEKTTSGFGNVQIGTYIKREDGNPSFQGAHFYHHLDANVYPGRRVYTEINRTPQHQVGTDNNTNWPEDPIASTIHYFDGLTRFYFDSQSGDWSNCSFSPVTFARVVDEPDQQVSSVTYQYTGSRYEVSWSAPKNSSLKFDIAYSASSMKSKGFASGTAGGSVSATGNTYTAILWTSRNMPENSAGMYVAIRPKGQTSFTEVFVPRS